MQLSVQDLQKSFGANKVLTGASFTAESGSALGLLGRNGAGKTTTIRIIMQIFPPDSGRVLLDGQSPGQSTAGFGYLPEEKGLYPKKTIQNQLVYLARLRGLSKPAAKKATLYWLDRLGISEYLDRKLETLSKGNQQKIQLALALLHDPAIIILDEPFASLDPVNAQLLKSVVHEQIRAGKIVIFSSHQMNYVEEFCDKVAILHQGRIIAHDSIRNLKRGYEQNKVQVRLGENSPPLQDILAREPALAGLLAGLDQDKDSYLLQLHRPSDRQQLLAFLAGQGLDLEQFNVVEPSLEDIFIEKAGDLSDQEK